MSRDRLQQMQIRECLSSSGGWVTWLTAIFVSYIKCCAVLTGIWLYGVIYSLSYSESLLLYNMVSLEHRRSNQIECNKFFESIVNNPDHKLHQLLPPTFTCKYNLRNPRKFVNPATRTKRFSSTFITSMCRRYWAALVLVSYYGYKFFFLELIFLVFIAYIT